MRKAVQINFITLRKLQGMWLNLLFRIVCQENGEKRKKKAQGTQTKSVNWKHSVKSGSSVNHGSGSCEWKGVNELTH